jgi:hypothetical protein
MISIILAMRGARLSRRDFAASCSEFATAEHDALPVALGFGFGMIRRHLVPGQFQRRQLVAVIAVAELRGPLQERGPGVHPHPEFIFLVRDRA